jgi:amino acid transporter
VSASWPASLIFVIVIGLPAWGRVSLLETPHGVGGLSGAAAPIFFAYLGFDELGNFAEEMREPERNLPRALFLSMAGATAIYVLVALSATAAVDWRDLGASPAPLALVARGALGSSAEVGLTVVALAATANTVLLLLVAASRSVYGMAGAGVLPRRLAGVGGRGIPLAATVLVTLIAAALVLPGDLTRTATLTDAAVLSSFMLVNPSLPWIAYSGVTRTGRARRLVDVGVPAVAFLMCAWLFLHTGWASMGAAAGLAVVGLALGYRRRTATGRRERPPGSGRGSRCPPRAGAGPTSSLARRGPSRSWP